MAKKGKSYVGIKPSIKHGKAGLNKQIQMNASDHADLVISKDMYKGGIGPTICNCEKSSTWGGIKEGY
jgi:hypothetical protein